MTQKTSQHLFFIIIYKKWLGAPNACQVYIPRAPIAE